MTENRDDLTTDETTDLTTDQAIDETAPEPLAEDHQVEVRRNVAIAAGVGGFAALLTVAFGARAFTGGTALDWLAFGVLALVTLAHLASLVDSRAPLLIADRQGVRLRQGATWRGIAWPDIDCLEHLPRRGLLRDGHLLVDGYDDQQLVVPLTLATRLVGATGPTLSDVLADLADGRADVVEVVPGLGGPAGSAGRGDQVDDVPTLSDLYRDDEPLAVPSERTGIAARVAAGLMAVAPGPREREERAAELAGDDEREQAGRLDGFDEPGGPDEPGEPDEPVEPGGPDGPDTPHWAAADDQDTGEITAQPDASDEAGRRGEEPPAPERPTVLPARVEVRRPEVLSSPVPAPAAPTDQAVPAGDTVTVVLDDLAVRPAAEPVIGPQLATARERLRLTVDQLSERTRIRPHVIEAIEVDDFGPCGGDFYARGHLRTLARVLGIDAAPLVARYDDSYAHAPVDARRVFESELATGAGGAIRSTRGGRNWSVLIAAVMAAVLVWSLAQLLMGGTTAVDETPGLLKNSGGVSEVAAAKKKPVQLVLTAAGGGAQLVVRDGAGEIVFDGNLAFGQTSELDVVPPVRIWSSDGSVTYALGGRTAEPLGRTGEEVSKTLVDRRG